MNDTTSWFSKQNTESLTLEPWSISLSRCLSWALLAVERHDALSKVQCPEINPIPLYGLFSSLKFQSLLSLLPTHHQCCQENILFHLKIKHSVALGWRFTACGLCYIAKNLDHVVYTSSLTSLPICAHCDLTGANSSSCLLANIASSPVSNFSFYVASMAATPWAAWACLRVWGSEVQCVGTSNVC